MPLPSHNISARIGKISFFFILGLVVSCRDGVTGQTLISPKDLKEIVDQPRSDQVILDVRTKDEVNKGIIPGALNLDFHSPSFQKKLGELDKSKSYYVYCHIGGRSEAAAKAMKKMGFQNIYDLEGGIVAWKAAGYPLDPIRP